MFQEETYLEGRGSQVGKAEVCKTFMHRFDSGPRLHASGIIFCTMLKCWPLVAATALVSLAAGATAMSVWRTRPLQVVDAYHVWYNKNDQSTYNNTRWLGVETQQCPLDMWVYQEMLTELKPDILIEAGTYQGGSAYFFASIFYLLKHGRVITVDIEDYAGKPKHDRITYLLGSSTSDPIMETITRMILPGEKIMVILDSDHHKPHVLNEMKRYGRLVSPGNYLIVQDTHFNGHPILPKFGPGPMEAVEEFLQSNSDFQPDPSREKFGMTFNPRGFLKRLR